MPKGRPRQEIVIGTIIGTWRILGRTDQRHNGNHKNYEYFYQAECVICGHKAVKRITRMREYPSHTGCPAKRAYRGEIAMKNASPGSFRQWIDERVAAIVDTSKIKQPGEQSKKKAGDNE